MKTWFIGFTASMLATLLLVSGAVIAVDPYGIWDVATIAGFNAEKPRMLADGGRVAKAFAFEERKYRTVILGSSRVQVGIDPKSAYVPGPAFNLGLQGTNFNEIAEAAKYVIGGENRPEYLVLGLDFIGFNARRQYGGDFAVSPLAHASKPYSLLVKTLSFEALWDAIKTVDANLRSASSLDRPDGSASALEIPQDNHRAFFIEQLTEKFLVDETTYANFEYGPDRLDDLIAVLTLARSKNVSVIALIPPVHAWQHEALYLMGHFGTFDQWKRDIVARVHAVNAQRGAGPKVHLVDFSGLHEFAREPVPPAGDTTPMRWYWDSSHFKRALGEFVLEQLFRPDDPPRSDTFGVDLLAVDLEAHIQAIHRERLRYEADYPRDVTLLTGLVRETEDTRQRLAAIHKGTASNVGP